MARASGPGADSPPEVRSTLTAPGLKELRIRSGDPVSPVGLQQVDRIQIEDGRSRTYLSPVVSRPEFNAAALRWRAEVPDGSTAEFELRFLTGSGWSDWQEAEELSPEEAPDGGRGGANSALTRSDLLLIPQATAYQYRVELVRPSGTAPSPSVSEVQVITIDSSDGPRVGQPEGGLGGLVSPAGAAASAPTVISRAAWGSPEPNGSPRWNPEYAPVKRMAIHHTAGGWNRSNPAESVRAIWHFHANTNGWGDVGYNFLVDGHGNVYEGRYGGANVIGGHVAGYNTGSTGFAVLGNYEEEAFPAAAKEALVKLTAWKGSQHGIHPGLTNAAGDGRANTLGHRDLTPTACPGASLYSELPSIRVLASNRIAESGGTYRAQFAGQSAVPSMTAGDTATAYFDFKNVGTATWRKTGANPVRLGTHNPRDRSSGFARNGGGFGSGWVSQSRVQMQQDTVAPGQTARFAFTATGNPDVGTYREYFRPLAEGLTWMEDYGVNLPMTVAPAAWYAQLVDQQVPAEVAPNTPTWVTVRFRNAGTATWQRDGATPFRLGTDVPNDRVSGLYTSGSWHSNTRVNMQESSVAPGQTATFRFQVTTPRSGTYTERLRPLRETIQWLGPPLTLTIRSQGTYAAQFAGQSAYPSANPGETGQAWVEFKNTGTATWDRDGAIPVRLGTDNPRDRASGLASGWLSGSRIRMDQQTVAPGQTARFTFDLRAPGTGSFKQYLRPVAEGVTWMGLPNHASMTITGLRYAAQFAGQSFPSSLTAGQGQTGWIQFKNTGTATWKRDGAHPMRLGTHNPRDRTSRFSWNNGGLASGWLSGSRIRMDQQTVAPGQTARFTFELKPNPATPGGTHREHFRPLAEGLTWLEDYGVNFPLNVAGGQSAPSGPGTAHVILSSTSPVQVIANNSQVLKTFAAGQTFSVRYLKNGSYAVEGPGHLSVQPGFIRVAPQGGLVTVHSYNDRPAWNPSLNDNVFRGHMVVRYSPSSNSLRVNNELNIEQYMRGLAEASNSDPWENITAMSVAARSYVHYYLDRGGRHPGNFADLYNSRNGNGDDQVYQGYNLEQRATNLRNGATATSGQVVRLNGSIPLTPYFSRSDGRTRSVSEVWPSLAPANPHLQSKPDPCCGGQAMAGHGVGLSGRGGAHFAGQGWNYLQILTYYYTGVNVAHTTTDRTVRVGIYALPVP